MKKEKILLAVALFLLAVALFLLIVVAGGTFVYWRAVADLTPDPAEPFTVVTEPVVAVDSDLAYDGVYIDLIEQAMIDAKSEEQQGGSNPDNLELHVVKYNSETGYVDGITATSAGITDRQLSFVYGGVQLDLHFVNDVLIGCRKTYEQELLDRLEGQTLESCTAEEREAAEKGALEVILNNDSWETDEDYLKLVLADYTEQVLEYQSEHPGLLVPKND